MPLLRVVPPNSKKIFEGCSSLSIISFPDQPPDFNSQVFANTNRNKIQKKGHFVYDITLCLPYVKNYDDYDVNGTKEWNQILADEPDDYYNVCTYTKDVKTDLTGIIVGVTIGGVALIVIIVVVSVLLYKKNQKNRLLRAEIDEHILLTSAVVGDFG
ncbi:hypothetical protein GPJ56_002227 [Histomonas meleagridis]|uniref:uncharacterized protein n=1 Tax=Histomonas meleagridis TaxID=135588 RepID=UPI003559EAB1|nr:hypothetical protein GPJ56_002227 [Histomonas meleagridis]KAH0802919.1 hypothetical protein GO595_004426 [Histomonas meleagridis]